MFAPAQPKLTTSKAEQDRKTSSDDYHRKGIRDACKRYIDKHPKASIICVAQSPYSDAISILETLGVIGNKPNACREITNMVQLELLKATTAGVDGSAKPLTGVLVPFREHPAVSVQELVDKLRATGNFGANQLRCILDTAADLQNSE